MHIRYSFLPHCAEHALRIHADMDRVAAKEYEKIKSDKSIRYPEKYFLQTGARSGAYQGCFSKSHWGGKRQEQKWDVLIKHAPKLAKRHCEVPNSLREVLEIKSRKWDGSKFTKTDGEHKVPEPLALALDSLVMDRLSAGEEVTMDFVQHLLVTLLELWNKKLLSLADEVRETASKAVLERQEQLADQSDATEADAIQRQDVSALKHLLDSLAPCNISKHPKGIESLVNLDVVYIYYMFILGVFYTLRIHLIQYTVYSHFWYIEIRVAHPHVHIYNIRAGSPLAQIF